MNTYSTKTDTHTLIHSYSTLRETHLPLVTRHTFDAPPGGEKVAPAGCGGDQHGRLSLAQTEVFPSVHHSVAQVVAGGGEGCYPIIHGMPGVGG